MADSISLLTCILFWSIHSAVQPVFISLVAIYKALRSQGNEPSDAEKSFNSPKQGKAALHENQTSSPKFINTKHSSALAPWRAHSQFEFPAKTPPLRSLRISHPIPLPPNEAAAEFSLPTIHNPSASISVSSHSRKRSNQTMTNNISPQTPRKSFSSGRPWKSSTVLEDYLQSTSKNITAVPPVRPAPRPVTRPRKSFSDTISGRKSVNVATAADQYQQPIARSLATAPPVRPVSKPVMPPAAFWRYAIDKQSIATSPGILQRWQLESDRRSWSSLIGRCSPVPVSMPRAITLNGRVKRRGDRASQNRSADNLQRRTFQRRTMGPSTECIDGITWEILEDRRRNKKLVKQRRSSR